MLFSEAVGQRVVSTGNAETVGTIGALVVDPAAGRVVALSLKKTPGLGDLLPWSDITAFGADAVTVADDSLIIEEEGRFAELSSKAHVIVKKRILSIAGLRLGNVRDVEFDPTDGSILSLLTDDQPVDGHSLIGVGSYAVMVRT